MIPWSRCPPSWRTTRLKNVIGPFFLFQATMHRSVAAAMTTSSTTNSFSNNIVHLNHAGASPMPQNVMDCLLEYQQFEQQVGGYAAAAARTQQLQQVYKNAASLIHAQSPELEIALVESATVAWTRLFYSFCAAAQTKNQQEGAIFSSATAIEEEESSSATTNKPPAKKLILVSEAEYAANLVAACQWCRTNKEWSVLAIPSALNDNGESTGKVSLPVFEEMLSGNYVYQDESGTGGSDDHVCRLDPQSIALVCITHIPTNSGIVNPVHEIGHMISEFNEKASKRSQKGDDDDDDDHDDFFLPPSIFYLVDACQSVGQMDVNVQDLKCHGLVATGRKYLRGPRGTGFLYIPKSLANNLWPHHVDHYGVPIQTVPQHNDVAASAAVPVETFLDYKPREGATRFEFWESNIGNKLGLGAALQHALDEGSSSIATRIRSVALYLYEKLQAIQGVQLYYKPECGIVTFWVDGLDSAQVKRLLAQPTGDVESSSTLFDVSVVPATSTPLDSARTGVTDLVRASVSYTSTRNEVDLFCSKLAIIIAGRVI